LSIADSTFEHTQCSFNKAVTKTLQYAIENIKNNGGNVQENNLTVVIQQPEAPAPAQSFPNIVLDKSISIFDSTSWVKKGSWKDFYVNYWWVDKPYIQALYAEKNGDEISIDFKGTGFSLIGNWQRDGGKADVYLDNKFMRTINTWYLWNGFQQEGNMDLFHKFNLSDGRHTVKLVVKGEKYEKSEGNAIYINALRVFKTAPKKSETYKFSFEK
jgi:hypothetical protein